MGTQRSKALHNFTLPSELQWGNQRLLRCMKVKSNGQTEKDSSSELVHGSHKVGATPPPPPLDGTRRVRDDDGIDAVREEVLLDPQTAADKMKEVIFKNDLDKGGISGSLPPLPSAAASDEGQISKPWNLRTRRAAYNKMPLSRFFCSRDCCAASGSGEKDSAGGKGLAADVLKPKSRSSQMRTGLAAVADKSPMLRRGSGAGEKRERPKFSVALSKGEIEEDFFAMVGRRPARRPKRRAKNVQRDLDTLFPGVRLKEVTTDMYKVSEAAP